MVCADTRMLHDADDLNKGVDAQTGLHKSPGLVGLVVH